MYDCTYIFRKLKRDLFYLPSTIGVAQTHTAEANAIKAINLIVEAMLRMIKTRTTNYETGFCLTEVRQFSASVINEVLIKPPLLLHIVRTRGSPDSRVPSSYLLERTPLNVEAAEVGRLRLVARLLSHAQHLHERPFCTMAFPKYLSFSKNGGEATSF